MRPSGDDDADADRHTYEQYENHSDQEPTQTQGVPFRQDENLRQATTNGVRVVACWL